jgi:membrane-associated protease RseP (regulator of RpoE activity)
MSLPESYRELAGRNAPVFQTNEKAPPPTKPQLLKLREALSGILSVAAEQETEQKIGRGEPGQVYIFRGRLLLPPESAYATLQERFKPLGFTPMLQRENGEEVIVAIEGDLPMRRIQSRWWVHLLLLLFTIITTTILGASLVGFNWQTTTDALFRWDLPVLWPAIRDSLPFSLTLLTILGVHEMGHYTAARLHKVKVTLPFFIPLPIPHSLGTMGAVIFIKSPLMNRKALFDVGVAGPLAGMVLAIPLFLYGLNMTPAVTGPENTWIDAGIRRVNNPPLLDVVAPLVTDTNNLDRVVFYNHPMALAAWLGVLLTSLNLLPMGQFDGGHISYALFGKYAWMLARFTFFGLLGLGLLGIWYAWLIWAFMGLLTGLRHPPPHDDLTPLGLPRQILGVFTILLFFVIITPMPFYSP